LCIALAGGVKSIEKKYINLIKDHGFKVKSFNKVVPDMRKKIEQVDAVVIFTGTVSHKMSKLCREVCKKKNIHLEYVHSSSMSQLEKVVLEIKKE